MRILSYNILDGGQERLKPLLEVITAERPDILCLVEADDSEVLSQIARALNMDFIAGEGQGHSAAIFSRWPILETINHAAFGGMPRSLLQATIAHPSGQSILIAAVHLRGRATDQRESERELELRQILEIFAPHRAEHRPHILAGDFNSNSPIQKINPDHLPPASRAAWDEQGGRIPRRVIQQLLDAGYVDTLHATSPDAASTLTSFTTDHPGQRLDYIFTHGIERARLQSAWITRTDVAKYASDHFPVGLELV